MRASSVLHATAFCCALASITTLCADSRWALRHLHWLRIEDDHTRSYLGVASRLDDGRTATDAPPAGVFAGHLTLTGWPGTDSAACAVSAPVAAAAITTAILSLMALVHSQTRSGNSVLLSSLVALTASSADLAALSATRAGPCTGAAQGPAFVLLAAAGYCGLLAATRSMCKRGVRPQATLARKGFLENLLGISEEQQAADEEAMTGMSEQERINYKEWKKTNSETNVMTAVSVAGLAPIFYLLWVAINSS